MVEKMSKLCQLCGGTGWAINRPKRVIGLTSPFGDTVQGDEHWVECPRCSRSPGDMKIRR